MNGTWGPAILALCVAQVLIVVGAFLWLVWDAESDD